MSMWLCVYCVIFSVSFTAAYTVTSKINYPLSTTTEAYPTSTKSRYEAGLEDYDEAQYNERQGKGMTMVDDHDYPHAGHQDHHDMPEHKAVKEDPWTHYYDFLITEGSFKFWAAFQVVTAILLVYSAFAAVYYAKFNVVSTDLDYDLDLFKRSMSNSPSNYNGWSGLSSQTFQRIFDALSSKKYS